MALPLWSIQYQSTWELTEQIIQAEGTRQPEQMFCSVLRYRGKPARRNA
jgi:hypothetical protein